MVIFSSSKKLSQNTVLFVLVRRIAIKKYATLVIAYLKRSFEEKSFHFFYWSDMIIQDNSYNKVFKNFVLSLDNDNDRIVLFIIIFCFSM